VISEIFAVLTRVFGISLALVGAAIQISRGVKRKNSERD